MLITKEAPNLQTQLLSDLYGPEGIYQELDTFLDEHAVIRSGIQCFQAEAVLSEGPLAISAFQKVGNQTGIIVTKAASLKVIELAHRYDYRILLPGPGPISHTHQYSQARNEEVSLTRRYLAAGQKVELLSPEAICLRYLSLLRSARDDLNCVIAHE